MEGQFHLARIANLKFSKPKKAAIVVGCQNWERAPFNDQSWEIWAFSRSDVNFPRLTRWFELQRLSGLEQQFAGSAEGRQTFAAYMQFMRELECPVYLQENEPTIHNSVEFPIRSVTDRFGPIFKGTLTYVLGLAIVEGYDAVGLWGIDQQNEEYLRQRDAIRYMLAIAERDGAKVQVPPEFSPSMPEDPDQLRTESLYAFDAYDRKSADGLDEQERDSRAPELKPQQIKKAAIVGGSPTRRRAPFKNDSWEIWAFSSKRGRLPRVTRWFELHAMTDLKQQLATKRRGRQSFGRYMRYMRRLECPVYMQKRHRYIPQSVAYPKDKMVRRFGRVFTSTASYLIALAIVEGYDEIGLWGVDPRKREYIRQRATIRYLLGVAKNEGIKIRLPRGCSIRIPKRPKKKRTRVLYAYGWRSKGAWWRQRVRRRRRRKGHRPRRSG